MSVQGRHDWNNNFTFVILKIPMQLCSKRDIFLRPLPVGFYWCLCNNSFCCWDIWQKQNRTYFFSVNILEIAFQKYHTGLIYQTCRATGEFSSFDFDFVNIRTFYNNKRE